MTEWHDYLIPAVLMDWLQEKFWPFVDSRAFGDMVLGLAIWMLVGVLLVLVMWIGGAV